MEPLSADDPQAIGEFRLHARLGAGGMGQVYLGFSPAGRAVAIKVIHPQYARNSEFLRRFSHEVEAASAVGGLYTAPVVDHDLDGAMPWLATAYVPGPTLASYLSGHGALPEPALWRLAAGLAEALRAVHAKGLIHRDLKPANVLLADNGPHVIDFGISRAASSLTHLTGTGTAIGTPGYMSPEQAQVQEVGPLSDLFSLGCVLAHAATGAPPFAAGNAAATLFKIVSAEPDLSAAPAAFRPVIEACLRKDPAQRPDPAQLIALIARLGPAAPPSLGSFWSPDVARVIAAEQAAQTPAGLTPPPPPTGPETVKPVAIPQPATAPLARSAAAAPPEHAATASALFGAPAEGGGATGHPPMISDGYYAAAQRSAAPPNPSYPAPSPSPAQAQRPVAPQAYRPQQGYPAQQPPVRNNGAKAPAGQAAAGPMGQPSMGRPAMGQYSPGPYPGVQYPVPQYPAGRRKPMATEIPPMVRNAARFMYAGCAAMAISEIVNLFRYSNNLNAATASGAIAQNSTTHTVITGFLVGAIVFDAIGLGLWLWLAAATRRGRGWARGTGTAFFAVYTLTVLGTLADKAGDPGAVVAGTLVWVAGLAAVICLWSRESGQFFAAWRRR